MQLKLACIGIALIVGFLCPPASAGCRADVPQAHLMGAGPFCFLGFCLYDAQLWAEDPTRIFDEPFALLITYRKTIKARKLVDTGIDEIERLAPTPLPKGTLDDWRSDMTRAFRDVAPGDQLCGVFLPGRGARFYANGSLTAEVNDAAFALAFFRIWLDPNTRASDLRRNLLGITQ